jgi:hypothetical protein
MDALGKTALRAIQECVRQGRYRLSSHFVRRMDQRILFWPDVQALVASARRIYDAGLDELGRPKWRLPGKTTDGLDLEIICVLDRNEHGILTIFITAYWT